MFTTTISARALSACCTLALAFTGFSARLVHIQLFMHDEYLAQAVENHGGKQIIPARRGTIQDAHGWPLAQNEPVKTVVADSSLIKDREGMAALLAGPLAMPAGTLLEKLSREHWSDKEKKNVPIRYVVLKKEVPETTATAIANTLAEQKLRGIMFEQDSVRVYPNGEMLCHVIGFTDHTSNGAEGVERSMDDYLRGHDGFRYTEHDRMGTEMVPYRGAERPARDGCNVRLTIDSGLQMIVESELDVAVKQYRPKNAISVMMRPQTGEIIALANWPRYNPNEQEGVPAAHRLNQAIVSTVEPGSIFKIVPTTASLSLGLTHPDTTIFCENGHYLYGGKMLHDHGKGYGDLTVSDGLAHSSNICMAKLAIQMGEDRLYDYVRRFGFGEPTGVGLPGEVRGTVHPVHTWSKISITRVPMGQEVSVTPLQMVTAMCAVANGGKLMMPQIVKEIVDADGAVVQSFPPTVVREVMTEKVAAEVRTALRGVITKGTAPLAFVPGFEVAGKTGTASKAAPHGGGYEKGKYVVSFLGFLPAENPEFVCLVMLDDANTKPELNYGGTISAPVFARIAERAARHLDLVPDATIVPPAKVLAALQAQTVRD